MQQFRTNELLNRFLDVTTLIDMRPLFHPSIEEVTVEGILHALSDPVRVAMYADIVAQECPQNCSNFLTVSDKVIPKSTLSQHFKMLREAGLIRSERHGVEIHNISRCTELEQRFPGLIRAIVTAHTIQSEDEARAKMRTPKRSSKRAPK
jgi:DNA-binding transcriptional ArsR family regulator